MRVPVASTLFSTWEMYLPHEAQHHVNDSKVALLLPINLCRFEAKSWGGDHSCNTVSISVLLFSVLSPIIFAFIRVWVEFGLWDRKGRDSVGCVLIWCTAMGKQHCACLLSTGHPLAQAWQQIASRQTVRWLPVKRCQWVCHPLRCMGFKEPVLVLCLLHYCVWEEKYEWHYIQVGHPFICFRWRSFQAWSAS